MRLDPEEPELCPRRVQAYVYVGFGRGTNQPARAILVLVCQADKEFIRQTIVSIWACLQLRVLLGKAENKGVPPSVSAALLRNTAENSGWRIPQKLGH